MGFIIIIFLAKIIVDVLIIVILLFGMISFGNKNMYLRQGREKKWEWGTLTLKLQKKL